MDALIRAPIDDARKNRKGEMPERKKKVEGTGVRKKSACMQQPAARKRAGVEVFLEEGVGDDVPGKLKKWGHKVVHPLCGKARLPIFGRGQMIVITRPDEDEQGEPAAKRARAGEGSSSNERLVFWAGSDGRGDGCAMGW